MDLEVTAVTGIGNITQTAYVYNSTLISSEGEKWPCDGFANGTNMSVLLSLSGDAQGKAKLGKISGVGADVVVNAEVPFNPTPALAKIASSRSATYTPSWDQDPDTNKWTRQEGATCGGGLDGAVTLYGLP